MTLPANKTILGLTTKKDILQLPGFENLGNYLLKELKEFVRNRMKEYTTKKRGFTVGEYMAIYKKNPEPYKPSKQTARKNIKLQVKANKDKDEDKPKTRVKEAKDITTNDEFQALLRKNIEEREREEAERDRKWEEAREAARRRRQQLFEESLEDSDEDNGYKPKKKKAKKIKRVTVIRKRTRKYDW